MKENITENKKIIDTIEKKLEVVVDTIYDITKADKIVTADVRIGENNYRKVVMKEMRNQYGPFYKIVSVETYVRKRVIAQKCTVDKTSNRKLRTKTEKLCGVLREEIFRVAKEIIESLANGEAIIKEIEGAAVNDTVIRFVLLRNSDGTRFKEDIEISKIREKLAS